MPKRSNPFQRLAAVIHARLGPPWKVGESLLLVDLVTGEKREVDIVAQSAVGAYPLFLSIECRDHARPADVTWIEGMSKKHEHLPTSKLVLWSRTGFTKAALRKAKALKITTVSQIEATRMDWARLARDLIGGSLQYVTPAYTAFIDIDPPEGEPRRLEDVANSEWFNSDGVLVGTVQALLHHLTNSAETREAILDHAKLGKGNFYVELQPPEPWFVELPDGGRARIRRVGVGIETFTEKVPIETASAISDGKVMTLASAKLAAGTFEVLVQESPDGNASFHPSLWLK